MKLIIVGRGLAGYWLDLVAQSRGIETTVIDSGAPGTAAALALLRPSHLPEDQRNLLPRSLYQWQAVGATVHAGAFVTRWDRPDRKFQRDWYAVEPIELGEVDHGCPAEPLSPTAVVIDSGVIEADQVVWCDGRGEGRRTYGVTWTNPNRHALTVPFLVHHLAPYKIMAAISYPSGCRIGSSSASSPRQAIDQGDQMLAKAIDLGWCTEDDWKSIFGSRLHRDHRLSRDADVAGAWRWSGFHRTGFGVVPALANDVLDRIEAECTSHKPST